MMSGNSLGFERLRGRENFCEWKIGAKAYLTSKGEFTECTVKLADNATAALKLANGKALADLTLLLDPSVYSYIEDATEAKVAWDSLINVFEDKGAIRKVSLLKQWISLKSNQCTSMHEYVNKNIAIRAKVKNAGFDISDEIAGCILLCGLSEEYNPLVMSMEAKEEITLDKVKNLLLQSIEMNDSNESAMSVKKFNKNIKSSKNKKAIKCYDCGGPHYKNKCPKLKGEKSEKSDIVLYTSFVTLDDSDCERNGSDDVCDIVSQEKSLVDSDCFGEECNDVLYSALAVKNQAMEDEWYIDSGATKHMTYVDHEMENVKKPIVKQVKAANGEKVDILRTGDLKCKIDGHLNFTLRDVQHIPKLCVNLLSVSQMAKNESRWFLISTVVAFIPKKKN